MVAGGGADGEGDRGVQASQHGDASTGAGQPEQGEIVEHADGSTEEQQGEQGDGAEGGEEGDDADGSFGGDPDAGDRVGQDQFQRAVLFAAGDGSGADADAVHGEQHGSRVAKMRALR